MITCPVMSMSSPPLDLEMVWVKPSALSVQRGWDFTNTGVTVAFWLEGHPHINGTQLPSSQ